MLGPLKQGVSYFGVFSGRDLLLIKSENLRGWNTINYVNIIYRLLLLVVHLVLLS